MRSATVVPSLLLLLFWSLPSVAHEAVSTPSEVDEWQDSVVLLVSGSAWCSGVIVDENGTVATAYHCVVGGGRTRIDTRDGFRTMGRAIAWNPSDDLALLSVPELAGRAHLEIREDDAPPGSTVYGLGHPFAPLAIRAPRREGLLLWSVTQGIVSAHSERWVQTDTALNPGNSGGPVVDAQGRIVGITSHKLNGDNVSFLSSARALRELIDEPERRLLGGTWGLGLGSTGGLDVRPLNNLSVRTEVVLRDRVVGSVNMGIPLRASTVAYQRGSSWAIGTEASISLRHRFGHGLWSTAIELGAGMTERRTWTAEIDPDDHTMFLLDERRWLPSASARIGSGGAWLRVSALVEDDTAAWLLAVETDWPGSIGFF